MGSEIHADICAIVSIQLTLLLAALLIAVSVGCGFGAAGRGAPKQANRETIVRLKGEGGWSRGGG